MAANGEIVPYRQKVAGVRALLEQSKTQIAMALPRHMNADRISRIAMTSIQRTPKLLDCTPESLCGAVIQSAQLGLEPDNVLGHAYLIPFYNSKKRANEVQFIAGYKGLVDLARRTGQVSTIYATVVREGDHFNYQLGTDPKVEHKPGSDVESKVTHAYAVCQLKDGGVQFEVMSFAAIEKIRKQAKAGKSGPWVTHWDEMAKKTVLRRLCKMLPQSPEMSTAVSLDERAEIGIPQDLGAVIESKVIEDEPKDELDTLADEIEGEQPADDTPLTPEEEFEQENQPEKVVTT